MDPLMHAIMVNMGRRTDQQFRDSGDWSKLCFSSFLEVASWGNPSLQYVNSNIEFLKLGLGVNDDWAVGDVPICTIWYVRV